MKRIMIFGNSAAGKSTFAPKLGAKLGLPVIHVDVIQRQCGRNNHKLIRDRLCAIADQDSWIIEGNAFRKEPDHRIRRADLIIVFDNHPLKSMVRHVARYWRIRSGKEMPAGGLTSRLELIDFYNMIFIRYPRLKRRAIALAKDLNKEIVIVHNFKEAYLYLEGLTKTVSI
ncbi:hypothetical protein JXA59_03095 [Patescibacteria group bacterium]|nr:hypothetical protein [Patescibacteria group bacterium]